MIETWNIFTSSDILLGMLGALGFLCVIYAVFTASSNVDKREKGIKAAMKKTK